MPNSAVAVTIKTTVRKIAKPRAVTLNTRVSAFARFAHWNLQSCVEVNSFPSSFSFEFPESFKVVVSSNQVEEFR